MDNNVKSYRLQANLSQKQLATATGITRQTLSLIEKGEYNPSLKLCFSLCHILNKTLDQLFWMNTEGRDNHEKNS